MRLRRIAVMAALLALVPCLVSLSSYLLQPSSSSLGIRTVEWLTDHGGRGLISRVENIYYSFTAPSKGGPGLKQLPQQPGVAVAGASGGSAPAGGTSTRQAAPAASYRPPAIAPILRPALPGEGVWRATYASGGSHPPVLVTSFRPEPDYPRIVAGVAWVDHTRTSTFLYPGLREPAVPIASRGPEQVPPERRASLVATFNSAFKLADSHGGVVVGSHTYAPLVSGLGTIVRYRSGQVDVTAWHGSASPGGDVVFARQNLPLIIDGGRLNPNLSGGPEWGATLGNAVLVWRSGVGIDSHGNLIYAAANDLTVTGLAKILLHAGAVRAMELDINAYWPSFITYRRPQAIGAANLLPDMTRSTQRYLTPDDRDFFAVYIR